MSNLSKPDLHHATTPSVLYVMGVSGSGKSTIAEAMAAHLQAPFKMSNGIPLTDQDRWPWLAAIRAYAESSVTHDAKTVVIACSALKRAYRDFLRDTNLQVYFLFLKGSFEVLNERMKHRTGHFMKQEMLRSQLATLESPEGEEGVFTISIDGPLEQVIKAGKQAIASIEGQNVN